MPEIKTPFKGAISIAKFISTSGFCSYRDAVRLVNEKNVRLNEVIVSDFWLPINPLTDLVRVNEHMINYNEKKKYLAFHKPVGYISSHKENEGYPTIYSLLEKENLNFWLTTAGRLDVDTSGLMILTNDTKMVRLISHPDTKLKKIYELTLDGHIGDNQLKPFTKCVQLKNGMICQPSLYNIVEQNDFETIIHLTLTEGKKRQIRRMCKVLRLHLKQLKRIQIGKYKLGSLAPGHWKEIQQSEII